MTLVHYFDLFLAFVFFVVCCISIVSSLYFRKWQPLLWIPYWLIDTTMVLIGFLLIGMTLLFDPLYHKLRKQHLYLKRNSHVWPERIVLSWRSPWMYLFGNEEDGIDGSRNELQDEHGYIYQSEWLNKTKNWPFWWRIFVWTAIRNPACNMRFLPGWGFHLTDPSKVQFIYRHFNEYQPGRIDAYLMTYNNLYCSLHLRLSETKELWFGSKIKAADSNFIATDDYRRRGCGFTTQIV